MKRRRKVLLWIVGVLIVAIAALVVAIATFDWNRLKPFIDAKVSQAIGRSFEIKGDLGVAWRREPGEGGWHALVPWPELTANDIYIRNPGWAKLPYLVHLEALRLRLSPLPLIARRILIPSVQLVRPQVDLERDAQGQASWDLALQPSQGPSTWQLDLREIGFDRGQILLDDAASKVKLQVDIEPLQQAIPYDQLVAQESSDARDQAGRSAGAAAQKALSAADQPSPASSATPPPAPAPAVGTYMFAWQAEGSYQGTPLKGSGRTGGTLALQQADRPFPVQAKLQIGDSHIALVGTLTDPVHLGALDLRLWFAGSSMAKLYPIIGVTLPDTPPYATEGHLKAELHRHGSRFSYENFKGRVGGSDIAGSLAFATDGPRPKLSGQLSSKLLQFSDLAPLIGADSGKEKQQRGDATPQPANKVLPVEPFRTDRWKAMDADVSFSGARILREKSLPIDSLTTHVYLDNGLLRLEPLSFGLAGGRIDSTIRLDGGQVPMQGALKLGARHLKLKQLFPEFGPMQTSFGEINGDAALSARGNSVAALLGTSNGELKLLMNDGAISRNLLEMAGLNVGNIVLGKLFGDKTVQINCAASDLVAKNGRLDTRLFVFDTQDAVINVEGYVNFADESMDLDIKPHTKGFRIFSLRSPLYVQGSFKNPSVGVHAGPLLLRGAGAVALGVVAPVAALIPLIVPSHDNGNANTCRTVLEELKAPAKPAATHK